MLRGWTNYHRHGAASKTFAYLGAYLWRRVWLWLRTKHPKATVRDLQRRYLNRWWPQQDGVVLFNPAKASPYVGGSARSECSWWQEHANHEDRRCRT